VARFRVEDVAARYGDVYRRALDDLAEPTI
jgi:hypothetical protein